MIGESWQGPARHLAGPDSLVTVFSGTDGPSRLPAPTEVMRLLLESEPADAVPQGAVMSEEVTVAWRLAQQILRERAAGRGPVARTTASLTLWMVVRVTV